MKKLMLCLMLLCTCVAGRAENNKPFTIPELTSWKGASGTLDLSGKIVVRNKTLRPIANQLVADSKLLNGPKLRIASGKPQKGDIVLDLKKLDNATAESYRLKIGEWVELSAPSQQGLYWGTQTLLQLMEQGPLPKGEALDVPQYRMRGFMLDVGRKFVPMGYLRHLVRTMAYYKMNTLQLHLNDNGFPKFFGNDWDHTPASFRLECDTYPGLASTDGHYTKKEFIELQQLAAQMHVEIIPEIDAPAHVLAFTHYRPELGSKEYGMDHFNLSNPAVYTFMDSLFHEYLSGPKPVFIGPRVNIGTDEYNNQSRKVVEQFRAFTDHYLSLVKSYGKKPALWGALTYDKGETPVQVDDVLMNCWSNGFAAPDSMARLGYQLLSIPDGWIYIVPAAGYYHDYLDCQNLYNKWTPAQVGNYKFPEQHPQIEGGMFAVWNDHYGNGISTKDIHHRLFPAMQTIATKCWSGVTTTLPYADFDKKRHELSEAPGINEMGLTKHDIILEGILPNQPIAVGPEDIGYDHSISFDIDCQPEAKGTILTQSDYATFYLSDPQKGQLAFARDGYTNRFNYRLPEQGKVNIRIECTNKQTALFVNGRKHQTLATHDVYAVPAENRLEKMPGAEFHPEVYTLGGRMSYVPTLMFPFKQTGDFKSKITNLTIKN